MGLALTMGGAHLPLHSFLASAGDPGPGLRALWPPVARTASVLILWNSGGSVCCSDKDLRGGGGPDHCHLLDPSLRVVPSSGRVPVLGARFVI